MKKETVGVAFTRDDVRTIVQQEVLWIAFRAVAVLQLLVAAGVLIFRLT